MKQCHGTNAAPIPSILLVGSSVDGGGAENRFRLLATHLFGGSATAAVLRATRLKELLPHSHVIDLGWAGMKSYPSMVINLRKHLKYKRYDAVLSLGFYPNLVAFAATFGLASKPKLILTEITRPFMETQENRSLVRKAMLNFFRRSVYPKADLFAANSIDGIEESVTHYGVERDRTVRITNLLDFDQLAARANLEAPWREAPVICMVARLDRMKRVDTLFRAAALLERDRPWRISIIGDGAEGSALKALADELGISDRIIFEGWRENPYPSIATADIFVLCSEYEGFSNSVIEAMALKTPVVTSYCSSDAREMCGQGAALGFEVGDYQGLHEQLRRLLEEPELSQQLIQTAWRYAHQHMVQESIPRYEALVRTVLFRGSAR